MCQPQEEQPSPVRASAQAGGQTSGAILTAGGGAPGGLEGRGPRTSRAYKATWGFLSLTFFLMELTAYFALKERAPAEAERQKEESLSDEDEKSLLPSRLSRPSSCRESPLTVPRSQKPQHADHAALHQGHGTLEGQGTPRDPTRSVATLTYCVSPWRIRSQIWRMDSQSVSSRSWLVALSTAEKHHYRARSCSGIPYVAPGSAAARTDCLPPILNFRNKHKTT